MSTVRLSPLALVMISLASGVSVGCAGEPCAVVTSWRNRATTQCTRCAQMNCAMENNALGAAGPMCTADFTCASRCPTASNTSCGCIDTCLATPACASLYRTLDACLARACDADCR